MFNRKIVVGLVKDEKDPEPTPIRNDQFQKKVAIVAAHLQRTAVTVGKWVLVYIAVDTIRQIAIEKAKK